MRIGLISYIVCVLSLLTAAITVVYMTLADTYTFKTKLAVRNDRLQYKSDEAGSFRQQNQAIESTISITNQSIKTKQTELDKLSFDLQTKKKALANASNKIKAQQAQLASESAELEKLKARADKPLLFSP